MTEDLLAADIRRAIILGVYIRRWGLPEERIVSRRGPDAVEVYSFPPGGQKVHRFATVGVSGVSCDDGRPASWELYMVVPAGLAGTSVQEVASFMLDVMAYSLRRDVAFRVGQTIPETPLMPRAWKPRALLLDELRGEPEDMSSFHVGIQHVKLVWLVPIHEDERRLIGERGLEEFDRLDQDSDWSLADPSRPSVLASQQD